MVNDPQTPTAGMPQARALYDAGDVVAARHLTEAVLAHGPTEAEKIEGLDLLARLRFPRVAFLWGGVAATLIVALRLLAAHRGG